MSDKVKFPRAVALEAARNLCANLRPFCALWSDGSPAIKVCGSLRRMRESVGDVEIVYVPRVQASEGPKDLLGAPGPTVSWNMFDGALDCLLKSGTLEKRPNKLGRSTWGPENKLAIHRPTGVPVDLFSTSFSAWWSYVVCRTGSAETNTRIASEALRKGWRWHPTAGHFTDVMGKKVWITCEMDVFRLVGMPYLEPKDR